VPAIKVRQIFSESALARLEFDEPVVAQDQETGIALHYRFEHLVGGRLRLSGGELGDQMVSIGCDEQDLNTVATVLLDGLKVQLT
jgi:hypothetical protein